MGYQFLKLGIQEAASNKTLLIDLQKDFIELIKEDQENMVEQALGLSIVKHIIKNRRIKSTSNK